MDLLLVRHGAAEPKADWSGDDTERPLSALGRLQVGDVAVSLGRLTVHPDLVVTSPYLRARQTADIVANHLGIADRVVVDPRLTPGFGTRQLSKILRSHGECRSIVLVGHEPDLGEVVRALTGGGHVAIRKAAVAQVDLTSPEDLKGRLVALIVPMAIDGQRRAEDQSC